MSNCRVCSYTSAALSVNECREKIRGFATFLENREERQEGKRILEKQQQQQQLKEQRKVEAEDQVSCRVMPQSPLLLLLQKGSRSRLGLEWGREKVKWTRERERGARDSETESEKRKREESEKSVKQGRVSSACACMCVHVPLMARSFTDAVK